MRERLPDVDACGAEDFREAILTELGAGLQPLLADGGENALDDRIVVHAARIDRLWRRWRPPPTLV